MIITKLALTNFRGFEQVDFDFKPGVNLIAGVNGAGKSSTLDALRYLFALWMNKVNYHTQAKKLKPTDVSIGAPFTNVRMILKVGDTSAPIPTRTVRDGSTVADMTQAKGLELNCFVHYNKPLAKQNKMGLAEWRPTDTYTVEPVGASTVEWIFLSTLGPVLHDRDALPFALYFSPQRSLLTRSISASENRMMVSEVHIGSLSDRKMNLRTIAEWWLVLIALEGEDSSGLMTAQAAAFDSVLNTFIPELGRVTPRAGDLASLEVTKRGAVLDVTQLSDGERGMLALVLEITRRLALANPKAANPAKEGKAVVLIDEIELHLHPQWQIEVIGRLERTFPNCQFIITTHSPLVIQQVKADRVTIIEADGSIRRPLSTLGLPVEEILELTQETPPAHQKEANAIMDALEEFDIEEADRILDKMRMEVETPNQLVSELGGLIANSRALLDDSGTDEDLD